MGIICFIVDKIKIFRFYLICCFNLLHFDIIKQSFLEIWQ